MMDCFKAQELISAALDNEVDDADELELAKDHCRLCPECASYVRALVHVRRAPAPEPPTDLTERIMAAVRAQARSSATPGETIDALTTQSTSGPADVSDAHDSVSASTVFERLLERLTDPRNRRAVVAWSATAAVVLVATGVGAVTGVRMILGPRPTDPGTMITYDAATLAQTEPTETNRSAAATPEPTSAQAGSLAISSPGGYITVDGVVYRSTGVDGSVTRGDLTPSGVVDTALDTGAAPQRRTVYGRGDPARVFVENDNGELIGFDRVTTTFGGNTYVLRSGPIPSFSDPVTLPREVPEPASEDGRPVFEPVDPDLQPPVYVKVGSDPSAGIALPPGARSDVSTGWTFWTPVTP